jgi:FixJ family two-component response regulator
MMIGQTNARSRAQDASGLGSTPRVAIVEDDAPVRRSLVRLLTAQGIEAEGYPDAHSFLAALEPPYPDVAVLDLQMPGMSGLQLQAALVERGDHIPLIFLSAYGTVPSSVWAMRQGAVDFFEKPADPDLLLEAIRRAVEQGREHRTRVEAQKAAAERVRNLSPRELEVFYLMVQGASSKRIASELGVVVQTAKVHRSRVMRKVGADSIADLVRLEADLNGRAS